MKESFSAHSITNMSSSSSEPVILVTAGSAGLGATAARLFSRNGYRVIINYANNKARAEALLAELNGAEGVKHIAIQADLASRTEVERLAQEALAAFGRLDVVFSNGGWTEFRDTTRLGDNAYDEDWDRAFVMNVKSHVWLLHAAEAALAEHEGSFITTASMAGVTGMGSSLAYAACKAAQIHMIKGLASMVGPNVRVNAVSPALMETEWAQRFSAAQKQATLEKSKLKRFVTVEVRARVLFCADVNVMC